MRYQYRQKYRPGTYIGIGIGWTHIGAKLETSLKFYFSILPDWVKTEAVKIAKWGGRPPLACRGVRSRALMLRAPLFVFLNPF